MTEETTAPAELTDEQLVENFPGQDIAHLRSMLEKSRGTAPEPATELPSDAQGAEGASDTVVYPDYIPEKFRQGSVEDAHAKLASSYKELERSRGTASEDASEASPPEAQASAEGAPTVSLSSATDEFLANDGVIADATYETLAKAGLSKELVNDYIAGQQAIAGQMITRIHEAAGGADAYSALMTWASANLNEAEISAYDTIINSGSEESIRLAVNGLKSQYLASPGSNPELVTVLAKKFNSEPAYQSKAEMTADMRDPRYKTDEAFRKQVERKLSNSSIWGR